MEHFGKAGLREMMRLAYKMLPLVIRVRLGFSSSLSTLMSANRLDLSITFFQVGQTGTAVPRANGGSSVSTASSS